MSWATDLLEAQDRLIEQLIRQREAQSWKWPLPGYLGPDPGTGSLGLTSGLLPGSPTIVTDHGRILGIRHRARRGR